MSNESFAITDGRCLALSSFQEGVKERSLKINLPANQENFP
ncbi:hypothetical protein [Okeania sp. KiyG1]|nr:hypothetical protein [Okeania sp. KiyG1]